MMIEQRIGHDFARLASAVEDQTCPEAQTYSIELSKQTVKNTSVLRFGKRSKQFWNQLQQLQFSSPSDCYTPQALRFYWQSQAQPVGRAPLSTLQNERLAESVGR